MSEQLNSFQGWGFTIGMSWVNHFLQLWKGLLPLPCCFLFLTAHSHHWLWVDCTVCLSKLIWLTKNKCKNSCIQRTPKRFMYMCIYVSIYMYMCVRIALWLLSSPCWYRREQTVGLRLVTEKGMGKWNLSLQVFLFIQFSLLWSSTPGNVFWTGE